MTRSIIRYGAFPLVWGSAIFLIFYLAGEGVAYWPLFPAITLTAVAILAILELFVPYEKAWNRDHGRDTVHDILHITVNQILIQSTIATAFFLRGFLPENFYLWPASAPMWAQILLAGVIIDFGLYAMHRYSHVQPFLWRLHMLHHSPERIYWMNGGRRHPISALILAGPSITILIAVGATPIAVASWLAILGIHLSFQHSNLDYRVGPLRYILCVAENHRWHHKREFEDAQVNFGEIFNIWDLLLGTFHDAKVTPRAGEVGLVDTYVPPSYIGQIAWPFQKLIKTK